MGPFGTLLQTSSKPEVISEAYSEAPERPKPKNEPDCSGKVVFAKNTTGAAGPEGSAPISAGSAAEAWRAKNGPKNQDDAKKRVQKRDPFLDPLLFNEVPQKGPQNAPPGGAPAARRRFQDHLSCHLERSKALLKKRFWLQPGRGFAALDASNAASAGPRRPP